MHGSDRTEARIWWKKAPKLTVRPHELINLITYTHTILMPSIIADTYCRTQLKHAISVYVSLQLEWCLSTEPSCCWKPETRTKCLAWVRGCKWKTVILYKLHYIYTHTNIPVKFCVSIVKACNTTRFIHNVQSPQCCLVGVSGLQK